MGSSKKWPHDTSSEHSDDCHTWPLLKSSCTAEEVPTVSARLPGSALDEGSTAQMDVLHRCAQLSQLLLFGPQFLHV